MPCGGIFDIDAKKKEVAGLEESSCKADFWNDSRHAQKILKLIKDMKRVVLPWEKAKRDADEIMGLYEMAHEEDDKEILH